MSLHGYHYSLKLAEKDPPFEALIMAAMRKADSDNILRLRAAFPRIWREIQERYNAPGGIIESDGIADHETALRSIEEFRKQRL